MNVIFLLEGEEEVVSGSLAQVIKDHRDELACDVIVVSDTGMAAPDTPTSVSYTHLKSGLENLRQPKKIRANPRIKISEVRI